MKSTFGEMIEEDSDIAPNTGEQDAEHPVNISIQLEDDDGRYLGSSRTF